MLALRRHHPGVRPAGRTLAGQHGVDLRLVQLGEVHDDLPRRADHRVTVLERLDLLGVVGPVLPDVLVLRLEQVDGGRELLVVERVRVLDAQVGLGRHQVERRVGDVDRRVVRGHVAAVGRRVVEHRAPRVGSWAHLVGAVHQQVGAAAVRDAVGDAGDAVPWLHLQRVEDIDVVGHQVEVDRLDVTGRDQSQRRIAGRRHDVVLPCLHQADHVVGGRRGLHVDLAAGLLLERGDPVDGRVGRPVLGVAGPGHDVQLALRLAELGERLQVRRGEGLRGRAGVVAGVGRVVAGVITSAGRQREQRRGRHGEQLGPGHVLPPSVVAPRTR